MTVLSVSVFSSATSKKENDSITSALVVRIKWSSFPVEQWHPPSKYSVTRRRGKSKREKKKSVLFQSETIRWGSVEYDRECQALSRANKLNRAHYTDRLPTLPQRSPARLPKVTERRQISHTPSSTLGASAFTSYISQNAILDSWRGRITQTSVCRWSEWSSRAGVRRRWEFFFSSWEKKEKKHHLCEPNLVL